MLYCLYGEEIYLINKKENDLIKSLKIKNIIRYNFDNIKFIDIMDEVRTVDLFNEKKLIIVSNFSFKSLNNEEDELLLKYINSNDENTIILKCKNEKLDERKKIIKTLKEKKILYEFKKLKYADLEKYVFDYIKESGYKINYSSVKRLVNKLESNSDLVFNELDKLMIYKINEKEIKEEDIDKIVPKNYEKEMFNFLNIIMNKDISKTFESYKILIDLKVEPIAIVDFLSKQFRTLYQIKNLKEYNLMELSRKLNVNEYSIKKLYNSVNVFNNDEIINIIELLFEADERVKIYSEDKFKVIENLLMNI